MTDYEKWDSYVANLDLSSSGEDEDEDEKKEVVVGDADGCKALGDTQEKGKYGWGKPLDEKGQIDRSGDLTVGNAKGNALSTNKTPQKVGLVLSHFSFHGHFPLPFLLFFCIFFCRTLVCVAGKNFRSLFFLHPLTSLYLLFLFLKGLSDYRVGLDADGRCREDNFRHQQSEDEMRL